MKQFISFFMTVALLVTMIPLAETSAKSKSVKFDGVTYLNLPKSGFGGKTTPAKFVSNEFKIGGRNLELVGTIEYNRSQIPVHITAEMNTGALTIDNRLAGQAKDLTGNFDIFHISIEKNAHEDTLMINKKFAGKDVLTLYLLKKGTREATFIEGLISNGQYKEKANTMIANVMQNKILQEDKAKRFYSDHWLSYIFTPQKSFSNDVMIVDENEHQLNSFEGKDHLYNVRRISSQEKTSDVTKESVSATSTVDSGWEYWQETHTRVDGHTVTYRIEWDLISYEPNDNDVTADAQIDLTNRETLSSSPLYRDPDFAPLIIGNSKHHPRIKIALGDNSVSSNTSHDAFWKVGWNGQFDGGANYVELYGYVGHWAVNAIGTTTKLIQSRLDKGPDNERLLHTDNLDDVTKKIDEPFDGHQLKDVNDHFLYEYGYVTYIEGGPETDKGLTITWEIPIIGRDGFLNYTIHEDTLTRRYNRSYDLTTIKE